MRHLLELERGRRCVVEGERRCGLLEFGVRRMTKVGQRIGTENVVSMRHERVLECGLWNSVTRQ